MQEKHKLYNPKQPSKEEQAKLKSPLGFIIKPKYPEFMTKKYGWYSHQLRRVYNIRNQKIKLIKFGPSSLDYYFFVTISFTIFSFTIGCFSYAKGHPILILCEKRIPLQFLESLCLICCINFSLWLAFLWLFFFTRSSFR